MCSDEACALVVDAVGELAELELLVCDECGCTLQVTSVFEVTEVCLPPPVEILAIAA